MDITKMDNANIEIPPMHRINSQNSGSEKERILQDIGNNRND